MANVEIKHSITITDGRGSRIYQLFHYVVVLSIMAFCIWLSKGSVFWTGLSGLLFIFFLFALVASLVKSKTKTLTSFDEVIAWAEAKKRAEAIEEA